MTHGMGNTKCQVNWIRNSPRLQNQFCGNEKKRKKRKKERKKKRKGRRTFSVLWFVNSVRFSG